MKHKPRSPDLLERAGYSRAIGARRRIFRFVTLAFCAALLSPTWARAADVPDSNRALLAQLRAGGLFIYFRHSLTVRSGQPDIDLSSCNSQRNLTQAGRNLAQEIGAVFNTLRIPVGAVLASPYCRCKETALLAFGRTEIASFLATNGDPSEAGERARLAELARSLRTAPPSGINTVYVAHGNNLQGLTLLHGYPELRIDEAEAVILRPRPDGTVQVVARVKGQDWRGFRP
jgi:broad specificity phosphatase PhoE